MGQGNPAAEQNVETGAGRPPATPAIERGTCFAVFAYDVGLSIDLAAARRRIADIRPREAIQHKARAPYYFQYQPPPLHFTETVEPVQVGPLTTTASVDAVIFDFGGISVEYSIPLAGPLSDLLALGDALYDHPQLRAASRRVVDRLLHFLGPAVSKPSVSDLVEDYVIYQLERLATPQDLGRLVLEHGPLLAQILRAERTPLSAQEVEDALACQIAFSPDDRAIIDWNAALLLDRDPGDVHAVLEFANMELLELCYLDNRLDEALDRAYEGLGRIARPWLGFGRESGELWRIAELQMDSARLFEGVNNALKLLGDQYLARVYRLASRRFHLNDWDASIIRKLQTTESIYQKISDRHANRRMELLEWIIILLIAVSILMPFVTGGHVK